MRQTCPLREGLHGQRRRSRRRFIRLSERQGLFLGEAIWTRYMPFTTTVADLVRNGVVGRADASAATGYAIADKERIVRPELCGGALLDLGVYPINFAFALFGTEVESVASSCVKGPSGVDMQESITFRYGDGRMAVLSATACCATDRQGIVRAMGATWWWTTSTTPARPRSTTPPTGLSRGMFARRS